MIFAGIVGSDVEFPPFGSLRWWSPPACGSPLARTVDAIGRSALGRSEK
jgi:hypothetical protein